MKTTINVSIIIPAYNAAATLGSLVRKILRETHASIELIVVDDGSTDNTGSIIRQIHDDRLILIEQGNQGVYAARNAALALHQGEWVIFLDADDDIADGFIDSRWQVAAASQADVVIFNAWHSGAGLNPRAVHRQQPCGQHLSGHDWIQHCVTRREWPHYLWLQIIRSTYIREHGLRFQKGKSHKDILWTIHLAAGNGRFYFADRKDYTYISNPASITHRQDYYDIRAASYIDVIADILALSAQQPHLAIRRSLVRHAMVECRHFLGLYRRKASNKQELRISFRTRIVFCQLLPGVSSLSDVFFLLKLVRKICISSTGQKEQG